jgi:Prenyltransferase and squalene oxidase repeat
VGLALSCAAMALVAKEIMNVYTWTLGAAHTPAAFLLIAGGALPFDITDTVASFLFGLAFGPELARLLGRMRARMTVTWEAAAAPPLSLLVLVCVGVLATSVPTRARGDVPSLASTVTRSASALARPATTSGAISSAVAYLQRAQDSNGGFGGAPGQHSSELYSAWAAMGLAAAGRNPLRVTRSGHSVLDALRAEASTLEDAGDDERTILALHACGLPASAFPGTSLVDKLLRERSRDGSFDHLVNITAFAIFALRVAGSSADNQVVNAAGRWLAAQQGSDGGFGFAGRGGDEDVDDTAAALQGVIDASGQRASSVVARGVAYLRHAQNPDGGFPQQPGGESNAQSTAWAVQGLSAAGEDVNAVKRAGSRSPLAPDGSVRYSRTSAQIPVWVTSEALAALAEEPFPIAPVAFSGN